MALLQSNAPPFGAAVFAHHQTAGKGQRGRQWLDEPGRNIALSVIIDTSPFSLSQPFLLSAMVAMGCHDFLSTLIPDQIFVKWPNDLYWRDRKAGGILIENLVRGNEWQGSVAGIGININQVAFPPGISRPVSLKQITGKDHDPVGLARELCNCLQNRYQLLQNNGGAELLADYNTVLFRRGERVRFRAGQVAFECVVKGVNRFGELEVEGAMKDRYAFGELEWLLGE